MFGKLVKNEFRNTWKLMTIINGALLVMHFIMMIFVSVLQDMLLVSTFLRTTYNIYSVTYILSLIGIQFAVFIFFSIRYYKKIYSDQGYLTHTLPVKKIHVTLAMVLSATVWSLITGIVSASYPFYKISSEMMKIWGNTLIETFIREMKVSPVTFFSLLITLVLGITCYYVLMFISITIGQNWKKHPLLGSVLVYWIAHTVIQTAGIWIMISLVESEVISEEFAKSVSQTMGSMLQFISTVGNIVAVILIMIGLFVNDLLMKKRLNL